METPKTRRTYIDHSACEHENTGGNRRLCRLDRLHDGCEHSDDPKAKAWCTRRKAKAAESAE
ncbi:hypothetical protein [Streptomyces californicus]|uniref:hypothetical protein n=1 Tax=Streptomyces TaxID=1883 RepID=UPI0033F84300